MSARDTARDTVDKISLVARRQWREPMMNCWTLEMKFAWSGN